MDKLLEKLAALEHEQWISWSKDIVQTEKITQERYLRWRRLEVPYEELTEEQKDQYRVWARKVLEVINKEEDVEPLEAKSGGKEPGTKKVYVGPF